MDMQSIPLEKMPLQRACHPFPLSLWPCVFSIDRNESLFFIIFSTACIAVISLALCRTVFSPTNPTSPKHPEIPDVRQQDLSDILGYLGILLQVTVSAQSCRQVEDHVYFMSWSEDREDMWRPNCRTTLRKLVQHMQKAMQLHLQRVFGETPPASSQRGALLRRSQKDLWIRHEWHQIQSC